MEQLIVKIMLFIIFAPIALLIGIVILIKQKNNSKRKKQINEHKIKTNSNENKKIINKVENKEIITEENKEEIVYFYKGKRLLTNNEKYYYNVLIGYANKYNYHLLAKVRLADLIEPDAKNGKNIKYAFYKIQAKHIDFAICDKDNLQPKIIIEIDDNSHYQDTRKQRDIFIDNVLKETGYKIIHIKSTQNIESTLNYILGNKQEDF